MARVVIIQLVFLLLTVLEIETGPSAENGFILQYCPDAPSQKPDASCLVRIQPPMWRRDYTYVDGIGGYKLHTKALPWAEARLICEEEGGHLAIINSVAESDAIALFFQRSKPIVGGLVQHHASIGFHDLYREGEYVTIHGESLSKAGFQQWAEGQPDNWKEGEDCGAVKKTGKLNDISCTVPYGFICEVPV